MTTNVLINGEVSDGKIPVTDSTVLRGDGCFEVIRSYAGTPFAAEEHLDRLQASAAALKIDLPPRRLIREWVEKTAVDLGDGAVRLVVSRGSGLPGGDDPSRVIVFGHDIEPVTGSLRLFPVPAPWHAAGVRWELSGSKTTSYAPNMSASRRARLEGADDALLVTDDEIVLEGPTFAVAWVHGDAVETPTLDLGILDSITRRIVIEVARSSGLEVIEGVWDLSRLTDASEVMAWSTVREVQAVGAVGDFTWEPGLVTADLAARFGERTGWGTRDH